MKTVSRSAAARSLGFGGGKQAEHRGFSGQRNDVQCDTVLMTPCHYTCPGPQNAQHQERTLMSTMDLGDDDVPMALPLEHAPLW